jgi:predicted transposase YdaD
MKESVTYQGILEEGKAIGELAGQRGLLLRLGTKRFGKPDRKTQAALESISSADELVELVERSMNVSSWSELFAGRRRKP